MDEPIIDAHQHIWRLARTPWLNGPPVPRIFGEYGRLRRDYGAQQYAADARACGVIKSVYVQINVAAGDEAEEVEWVQAQGAEHGVPNAIIGYADLASPQLAATLDRHTNSAGFRGIRQQLHWHANPAYRFAARPDLMNDAAWQRGLGQLSDRGLIFELQIFPGQMTDAARVARAFPRLTFVLLHGGMLEDTSAQGWTAWRSGMRALAEQANVVVKLSGLGTFSHACSVALWQPIVRETLDLFGAERAMFGSNFPIESLWTTYDHLVAVMRECIEGRGAAAQRAILHDNASRVYRI